jgi:hypothetical protein
MVERPRCYLQDYRIEDDLSPRDLTLSRFKKDGHLRQMRCVHP